jgi:DNA-nicking Smr family endonuclease
MGRVDLHGIKHRDVKQILDSKIYACMESGDKRLYVITGYSLEMKKIVTEVAREYKLTAVDNMFNGGEMIIDF